MDLPQHFVDNVVGAHGDRGRAFIASLPSLLDDLSTRFRVRIEAPYELSFNYVARAVRIDDGVECVVRCGVDLSASSAVLRAWNGRGSVRLIAATTQAELIERLDPGARLDEQGFDDDDVTRALAKVMRALPAVEVRDDDDLKRLPTVEKWGEGFTRLRAPFPQDLVDDGARTFAELAATQRERVVLHGDLHAGNVLSSGVEWRVIDPQGVVGERAYECGCAIRNVPRSIDVVADSERARAWLERRVALFADKLALPRERIARWAFAQAVLSAWWTYEDLGQVEHRTLAIAALLRP